MRRFWSAYGSPKNPDNLKSVQETPFIAACANRELESLYLGGDNVTVIFDDDTTWYDTTNPDRGLAVVKLLLYITLRDTHKQGPIGCDITFSSVTDDHFDSIVSCWPGPKPLGGQLNNKGKSRDVEAKPSGEGMGFGGSVGGMNRHTEEQVQSNWSFRSRFYSSKGQGRSCDTLALTLLAPRRNDRVSFGGRALYAAAILGCHHSDLEVRITGRRAEIHETNAFRWFKKPAPPVRFGLKKENVGTPHSLDTLSAETERWMNAKTTKAIPGGKKVTTDGLDQN